MIACEVSCEECPPLPGAPKHPATMLRARHLLLLLVLPMLWLGCDDTLIDPFDNDERYFTVYGFLDQLETEHTLRVVPISRFAENILTDNEGRGALDAEVYTTDLVTGARTRWAHKYSELENGKLGHVFTGRFQVVPRRTYRLEVIRSDGKGVVAETTVPAVNASAIFEKGPVVFNQDSTEAYQDISIPEVTSPWDVNLIYLWSSHPINRRIMVPYGRPGERTENGWRLRVNLSEDQLKFKENVQWSIDQGQIPNADSYNVNAMGIQIRVLDANWDPPEGIFDPEVLAQPGTMSNVQNGYGFFGSIGLYREEWNIFEYSRALGHPN